MKKQLLFIVITICIFLVACQSNNNDNALPTKNDNNRVTQVKNSSPNTKKNLTNRQVSDHLANVAGKVPNVIDAAALIAGPYAVVGINVDKDLDKSRVGTIKYSVTEALHHDPYGRTAVVVADADITQRLRSMGNKIKQGHPVQGIVDELAAIVGRYIPEVPIKENQPDEPDQNKKVIPKEDKQDLDDIQKDQ